MLQPYISAIDVRAKSVKAAAAMLENGNFQECLVARYTLGKAEFGEAIMDGNCNLTGLAANVMNTQIDPRPVLRKREFLENIVNRLI